MPPTNSQATNRRTFLRRTGAAVGAAATLCASPIRARGRLEKPTLLGIGAGGKGKTDLLQCAEAGFEVVALADVVDARLLQGISDRRAKGQIETRDLFPNAQFGTDYREMIAQLGDQIDGVVVSTPDHHHFHASMQAMQAGKHVYCQKPLTHGIWEARTLARVAQETGVKTQMGNQAHANDHMRRCVELIRAGIVGRVQAVHTWTNRPIWAQGFATPPPAQPIPKGVNWNQWIGPAPHVDYSPLIAPFAWRGWWNYGTGALGDMACHIMDLGYWSMHPEPPVEVVAHQNGATALSPPINSKITWKFGPNAYSAKDGFQISWYDGYVNAQFNRESWALDKHSQEYNHPGEDILEGMDFEKYGSVIVGEHGKLFFNRSRPNWVLKTDHKIDAFTWPEQSLPRAAGQNNYREWYEAVQGRIPRSESDFELAGPMTETILLGVLAQRSPGESLRWLSDTMQVADRPDLDKYIRRDYAPGWDASQLFGV